MKQNVPIVRMRSLLESPEGWGRSQGREVYQKLLDFVEQHPGADLFKVSLEGVRRVDISFASETIVELARRYRGSKGFYFVDLSDPDMRENWDAAAARKAQPLMAWQGDHAAVLGAQPSKGILQAFQFILERQQARAAEFAAAIPSMSIANSSSKFKQLWEQGFLLRREDVAESGGVEFVYFRIG